MIVVECAGTVNKTAQIATLIVTVNVLTPSAPSSATEHVACVPRCVAGNALRTMRTSTCAHFCVPRCALDFHAICHVQKCLHVGIHVQVSVANLVQNLIVVASTALWERR